MTLPEKSFFRVKEICIHLNIGRMTLWRRIRNKKLPELEIINKREKGYSRNVLLNLLR
jgi:hypothetical protein